MLESTSLKCFVNELNRFNSKAVSDLFAIIWSLFASSNELHCDWCTASGIFLAAPGLNWQTPSFCKHAFSEKCHTTTAQALVIGSTRPTGSELRQVDPSIMHWRKSPGRLTTRHWHRFCPVFNYPNGRISSQSISRCIGLVFVSKYLLTRL